MHKVIAKVLQRSALFVGLTALAGCFGYGDGGAPTPDVLATQGEDPSAQNLRVIGDGSVTVAMLLPLSAGGSASQLAQSFQNAAELAMNEVATDNIRVVVRDTAGETDVAQVAAEAAIAEGAQLILGPVFAPAVSGVVGPARAAGVPVVAFSTDSSVAGRGTYLLSFLPKQDATRIVGFAAERGVTTFAGLVPDNGYGLVMEAALREAVASAGGRVVALERYAPDDVASAAQALAGRGAAAAVFVPNGGDDPAEAARALAAAGIEARLLGSGQWDNRAVVAEPELVGAWYPGAAGSGFDGFAERYRTAYQAPPPRTASLVYDATLLANGLVGARGAGAFRPASLQTSDGFLGVDGIFRLTRDGLSERGLAVYEVGADGASTVVSEAPSKFPPSF
ncbi:penicillin-binding protein activator [Acuticoccus sp.]|uniref:penicillin-binding protein activator n=1 Tax=Acuticoccus sp. TaxID=1904378 RepID=UPI003B51BC5D